FKATRARTPVRALSIALVSLLLTAAALAAKTIRAPEPAPGPATAIIPGPRAPEPAASKPEPELVGARALRSALDALAAGRAAQSGGIASGGRAGHPEGPPASELLLVELRSLPALHREAPALGLLAPIDLALLPRAVELSVLRAELWARRGRCDRAAADRAFA